MGTELESKRSWSPCCTVSCAVFAGTERETFPFPFDDMMLARIDAISLWA